MDNPEPVMQAGTKSWSLWRTWRDTSTTDEISGRAFAADRQMIHVGIV
jgi:hypothetical protein